jgi:hypothetical protein
MCHSTQNATVGLSRLDTDRKYSIYEADLEQWISILRLACTWGFAEVTRFAIRELERQKWDDSLEKILIYHRYGVDKNLLIVCLVALLSVHTSLTHLSYLAVLHFNGTQTRTTLLG